MKARIKATGEIVEIAEYSTIYAENYDTCFYPSEVEFLDNSEDYWTRLEHQYAGMAMQAMLTSPELMQVVTSAKELLTNEYAKRVAVVADRYATALVEKLKEEK